MKPNRALISAGYLIAAGLVLAPLAETLVSIWPLQLATVSWRFGATGLISRGLLTSLLGLLLTGGIALAVGHRRLLIFLSALCATAAVFLFAGTILMVLDTVQFRASVNPEAKTGFDMAAVGAVIRILHAFVATILLAWGSWAAGKKGKESRPKEARENKIAFNPPSD